MQPVRFASSERRAHLLACAGVVGVLVVLSERWPLGQRSDALPVRVHQSTGWGQPAVGGASVFYLSRAHELLAINRVTGAEVWRRALNDAPGTTAGSAVVLSGGTVIAGDGDLFAFDAQSGAPRWRTVDGEDSEPGRFLGAARDAVVFAGSAAGWLAAWSTDDGRERWRLRVAGTDVTVFAPVAEGDLVVAAFTDFATSPRSGGIVAADATSGRQRWLMRFPRVSAVRASSAGGPPALVGHVVATAATDGTVYVMNRATGDVEWTIDAVTNAPQNRERPLAPSQADEHEDYRVVKLLRSTVLVSSLSGVISAVDAATRDTVWRYASPQDGSNGFGLTVADALAYVPFASGRLAIVDVETGRARAVIGAPGQRFDWPPAVADRRVFLTAEDGLYVVDLH